MPTIDADAHVIESERTWQYIEADELRPSLITSNGGKREHWLIDGRVFSRGVNVNRELPEAIRDMRDVEGRLRHMDELGIDIQVLYPSLFLRPLTAKPHIEEVICHSYNQWLVEICRKSEGRLRWIAMVPMMNMDSAAAEARFAKANGACGIFSRGLVDDKRLSDPFFFPLYREAERLDLPICVHASTGNFDWVQLFEGESGFSRFKVPVLSAFHSIVHDGIPQKFPNLRFGFIEVRAQWIPYMAVELAKRFDRHHRSRGQNIMRDNHVYVACQTDDDLPYILKYSGEDNIVIGSDYGHADTSAEIEALRKLKQKGEVEPRVIDKILYENARALYGL
ncbi:MAG TPA: amidohydrolase family protein [Candidatus Udaeobacter sp.]|nr:amidohydrolase family protein [Candidatus Udaeobacter sp.]